MSRELTHVRMQSFQVREKKRLTYDANFHLTGFERIRGGWYLVTVTAKPEQVRPNTCNSVLSNCARVDVIMQLVREMRRRGQQS
jgi:hypothetical protein